MAMEEAGWGDKVVYNVFGSEGCVCVWSEGGRGGGGIG